MALEPRHRAVAERVPSDLACLFVQCEEAPFLRLSFLNRLDIAVESHLEFGLAGRGGGGQVNAISPNNGAGMSEAWQGCLPPYVRAALQVPLRGQGFGVVHTTAIRSAKLRPVCGHGRGADKKAKEYQNEFGRRHGPAT